MTELLVDRVEEVLMVGGIIVEMIVIIELTEEVVETVKEWVEIIGMLIDAFEEGLEIVGLLIDVLLL